MTPTEVAAKLRAFNEWRRGGDIEQPGPLAVGEAIDAAIEMIERLEAAESALSNLGVTSEEAKEGLARHKATLARLEAAEKETASWKGLAKQFGNEADAMRAKIEAMERQEPVGHVWRCDNGHIHGSCEQTLPMGTKLYALPGAKGE